MAGRDGGADGAARDAGGRAPGVLPAAAGVAGGGEPADRGVYRVGDQQQTLVSILRPAGSNGFTHYSSSSSFYSGFLSFRFVVNFSRKKVA